MMRRDRTIDGGLDGGTDPRGKNFSKGLDSKVQPGDMLTARRDGTSQQSVVFSTAWDGPRCHIDDGSIVPTSW